MASTPVCAECGAPLPENAPGNRCPKCLLQLGLEETGENSSPPPAKEDTPPSPPEAESVAEQPGTLIGRYRLLQEIGEGGFGVVFMAEQTEPVQRKVALKVIKAGMDTREIIARFEAERQALALMDHPNIARVLDAGTTSGRRPYFVMELVKGIPITGHCNQASLSTAERLELFIQVCRAVQHAHQKGIIHRDLKPGNVLVTLHDGEAVPKVIDFGVAKALGQKLTEKTLFTRFEQMIGTPAYMSPEQAALGSLDIDTRSDVYSLGVLLYELLTGVTPLDAETLKKGALDEIRRMIRETDPPKPSTRLLTLGERLVDVAKHHQVEPAALSRMVRGDLDWITMKCLEKDRTRRYDTVSGLARDLERHLNNEPVLARPPSRLYEFQKTVRRHKFGFAATAAVIVALSIGIVVSTLQAVRARKAEREQGRLLGMAEQAKHDATEKLWASYLAEARAGRHSGEPGQRFETLTAVSNAAAIRPSLELRNEAIAAMALTDVRWLDNKAKHFKPNQEFATADAALKRYAVLSTNGTISIRRLSDDRELVSLPSIKGAGLLGHDYCRFVPNGDLFVTPYADQRFRFWDLTLGEVVWELPFCGLIFSHDYKTLAAIESTNITFYDFAHRERLSSVTPDGAASGGGAFDPGGSRLAYPADDTNLVVLDIASGKTVKKLPHPMTLFGIKWHPRENYLAVACEDNLIHVWDTDNWSEVRPIEGHTGTPVTVDFSHDGRVLVSSGWDDRTFFWDFSSGRPLVRMMGKSGFVWFGPDDSRLVFLSWDYSNLAFLELAGGQEVRTIYEQARVSGAPGGGVYFSAGGRWLAYETVKGMSVYDLHAEREAGSIAESGWLLGFGPGDEYVVGALRESNGATRVFHWPVEPSADGRGFSKRLLELGTTSCNASYLSADGKFCVAVDDRGRAQVFRTDTLDEQSHTDVHLGMRFTAVSPDDNLLATATWHGRGVKVWDSHSGKLLKALPTNGDAATVVFSPDGRWLVVGEHEHYQFWDTQSWSMDRRIQHPPAIVPLMRFSPDGKILAGSGRFSNVILLDAATGKELAQLEPPTSSVVTGLSFSPDGTQLAVAESLRALRLWNLRAIRQQLANMHLDWDLPPYAAVPSAVAIKR
jgi:serine/threonine protein kinase/WD40 repeat protein